MKDIIDCPALHGIDTTFPPRFFGRVPKRIKMTETVKPDIVPGLGPLPGYEGLVAVQGNEYACWTNRYGAVAVVFDDGRKLGVKPNEFEVVEFYPQQ